MEDILPVIRSTPLFSGIADSELAAMLDCLDVAREKYPRDAYILRSGERAESLCVVLSGSVLIIQEDVWGNRNILARSGPGHPFAAAYACAPGSVLNVSAVAEAATEVMFMNIRRVLTSCSNNCEFHNRMIRNLLAVLALANLQFNEKLTHIAQRTTRAKILSYLSNEARRLGNYEFDIPFTRQQLADYLAVERSGLSMELGKLRKEGLLEFSKNHFKLKI